MILLYTLVLLVLGFAAWLVGRRAASLERKFSRAAMTVAQLAGDLAYKPGNGVKDLPLHARRTFELGRVTTQRDHLENRYFTWRALADKLGRWMNSLRTWKGQKLPYSLGALDVWLTLSLLDHLGGRELFSVKTLLAHIAGWFGN